SAKWKGIAESMSKQLERSQADGTIADFWRRLPRQSSDNMMKRVQNKQVVINVKRLHKRDNTMSMLLDKGLVEEVRSKVALASSSSKKKSEDVSDVSIAGESSTSAETLDTSSVPANTPSLEITSTATPNLDATVEVDEDTDDLFLDYSDNDDVDPLEYLISRPPMPSEKHRSRQEFDDQDLQEEGLDELYADIGDGDLDQLYDEQKPPSTSRKKRKAESTLFMTRGKASFTKRFQTLGDKWVLSSGTVVEEVLYKAGMECVVYNAVHSFMIDMMDPWIRGKFSASDWAEISQDPPSFPSIPEAAVAYLTLFDHVHTVQDLETALQTRPSDSESQLVHQCLLDWLYLFRCKNPSPFTIARQLPELWWQERAWGIVGRLAQDVEHCFILPGDIAGIESSARRNRARYTGNVQAISRKRMGVRGDSFWRSFEEPQKDWAVMEAAKIWSTSSTKYIIESSRKLPRQLHDILVHRTREVGRVDLMRRTFVPGLVIGGPVIQQLLLCWGLGGTSITRLFRSKPTRIEATIDLLTLSLDAIFNVLYFRMAVLNFMAVYKSSFKINVTESSKARREALAGRQMRNSAYNRKRDISQDLLHSSP
ncbi:hypothetical protein BGZ51_003332, partial [Haplosporangium sp. Z 767]